MMDLDGFKRVNDIHGHLRGDDLLRRIAEAIGGTTRATDVAGRYGGDEFAILLADTNQSQARAAAERLVHAVREAGSGFDAGKPVTASVGVAVAHDDDDPPSLLRRADEHAYRAKERGGNCVDA
jgi:diguanylate cyclase (GGDEF)-like protein